MGPFVRLALVALTVGLADSLTPENIGPALYLATLPRRLWRVAQFTLGVFAVEFLSGLVLTTGPGRWLLGLVPHPQNTAKHAIELAAGAVLVVCGVAIVLGRKRLAQRRLPTLAGESGGGSAIVAGASITAVGMPTAVPYIAVIAAIVASSATIPEEIVLLVIYNLAFVAPLIGIFVLLLIAGHRADRALQQAGIWLQRQWPLVLAGLLLFVGAVLVLIGGAGLASL